ncbi:MAG: dTDP-4-dehydrorhamnose reductase [Gemmatimonadaceae bacterium]
MTARPVILLFGGTGQIGHELARELRSIGSVIAPTRHDLDLDQPEGARDVIRRVRPAIVANAAAYTAVDDAESNLDACMRLNAQLPDVLARECRRVGAVLVHFSTDYVFDGTKRHPYVETDEPCPLGVYGASKLAGERAVASAGGAFLIARTSWVYAARGRNFPLTMLRLARQRMELRVVNDQVGAPTSAPAIAAGVSQVLNALWSSGDPRGAAEDAAGLYHMTASGSTTWFEFAKVVLADDPAIGGQTVRDVVPIATAEYPTPAKRPAFSVLNSTKLAERFGVRLAPWREQWSGVAGELRRASR